MRQRPNPEKLLKQVQQAEQQAGRGKLKIYLGAAPGVGKTYMMLKDAQAKRAQGLDVVVGVVESHGRKEIIALLNHVEILAPQEVAYRDKKLPEFDLDAALKRNPGLILIDEMAHTNVPGLRHTKRWQDIKEILDRGIDVYTTLNVQHIESLNDVVSQIIHTRIKETVPDSMIEMATTLELIDLPPDDLLKRLHEGKVYFPQQAELAAEHFFRKGNLTALRELALRVTAERVGMEVLHYRQDQGIKHIWPTREKILVCVGKGAQSTKLIRAARRMAASLQAEWLAVHVDAPRLQLSESEHHSAIQNLRLAEQLGAQTRILSGFNLVSQIMDFAREQNITKLIVGKTAGSRWVDLLRGSLADEFVRYSGEIDVYIITSQTQKTKKIPQVVSKRSASSWKSYLFATLAIALTTGINFLLLPFFNDLNLMMVYLLSLTGIALFGEIGPTMMASMLSFLSYVFLLQGPTLVFSKLQDIFSFLVLLVLTQVISRLTRLMRRQAETSNAAERRSAMLQSFSRELGSATDEDKLLQAAVHYLAEFFNSEVVVLLSQDGHLEIKAAYKTESLLDTKEQGVAQWVYDLGQIAGLGTDTLPFSDSLYLPIKTSQETLGVLALRPPQKQLLFTLEQIHLLEACANQIALALEVERLQEQSKKSEFPTGSDRMRSSLLQAVSKEMRLPLISVMSAASTLTEMSSQLKPQMVNKLATVIYTEASQIGHFINNLLQITYLESEEIKLKKQLYSLPEEIQVVLKTLDQRLGGKPVKLHFPDPCPLVPFDKVLLDEVFYSLIDNAIKYTKPHSQLDISGAIQGEEIIISIEDRGPGIIANELDQLFEKFYRGRLQTTERGLGLGLAICHHIIIAHGGKIWAENRKAGGAAFRFSLPLKI